MSTNECFQNALTKANDPAVSTALDSCYTENGFTVVHRPKYNSTCDQHLQKVGCDVLLFAPGNEPCTIFLEEKIWRGGDQYFYPEFKTNGRAGWAVSYEKESWYLVCVTVDEIYFFHYKDFRSFCIAKQQKWEQSGYMVANDNNVYAKVPIEEFLAEYKFGYYSTPLGGYLQ